MRCAGAFSQQEPSHGQEDQAEAASGRRLQVMPDTRALWNKWTFLDAPERAPMTPEQEIACLEIDLALVKEAYEAKLAGYPSVNELPIYADGEAAAIG